MYIDVHLNFAMMSSKLDSVDCARKARPTATRPSATGGLTGPPLYGFEALSRFHLGFAEVRDLCLLRFRRYRMRIFINETPSMYDAPWTSRSPATSNTPRLPRR